MMSPLDHSRTLLVGSGLLVLCSLSGPPVIKQLMQMVTMMPGQGGGFSQCASPNKFGIQSHYGIVTVCMFIMARV